MQVCSNKTFLLVQSVYMAEKVYYTLMNFSLWEIFNWFVLSDTHKHTKANTQLQSVIWSTGFKISLIVWRPMRKWAHMSRDQLLLLPMALLVEKYPRCLFQSPWNQGSFMFDLSWEFLRAFDPSLTGCRPVSLCLIRQSNISVFQDTSNV